MTEIRVFVTLLVFLSAVQSTVADCDATSTKCFTNFSTAVYSSLTPLDPNEYLQNIRNSLWNGRIDTLCEAQANLSKCLLSGDVSLSYDDLACVFSTKNNTAATILSMFYQLNETCQDFPYRKI